MNRKMIAYVVGKILLAESALLMLPELTGIIYGEKETYAYLLTALACLAASMLLGMKKPENTNIRAGEGFAIVSLGWVFLSIFGCLPFIMTGEIPSFVDAFFETVSGFTTTGASILTDVTALSRASLFWRSFTHWIGGMGVLVFIMAVLPLSKGGGDLYIMRAESPGPNVGKLVPRSRSTARILYLIYLGLSAAQVILLLFGGNTFYDSLLIMFGTAGTGGFSITAGGMGDFSYYSQVIMTVFMALFGVNFNLYFLLLMKKVKDVFKSDELRVYLGIMFTAMILIAINISSMYQNFQGAFHDSAFQVSSIMTTTGYTTANYDLWPDFSKCVLMGIMCLGACAGSTGGGFKIARVVILWKYAKQEMYKLIHKRSVKGILYEGKPLEKSTIKGTLTFLVAYIIILMVSTIIVALDNKGMTTSLGGVIATLNNIGPGFGICGAVGSYTSFSVLSKIVFIFDMLLGRLEIFPFLILFGVFRKR